MAPRALQMALQPAKREPTRANGTGRGHNLTWYNPIPPDPTNQPEATTNQMVDLADKWQVANTSIGQDCSDEVEIWRRNA
jgi:hypothetical protein